MDKELISLLFSTNAFKVSDSEKPFWYASGKIGPYFLNVEYLYGSKEEAKDLIKKIDNLLETSPKEDIPGVLYEILYDHYEENEIYKTVIDKLTDYVEKNIQLDLIDYISGGEKKDWIFSILVANFLGKPHISIFNDGTTIFNTSDFEESTKIDILIGKRVLNISDMLSAGARYKKILVPAINKIGSKINWGVFVFDRNIAGRKNLAEIEVQPYSMINFDNEFLTEAIKNGAINDEQKEMLESYAHDPDGTMRKFINLHPDFIDDAINNSNNTEIIKRAKICKEKDYYGNTIDTNNVS